MSFVLYGMSPADVITDTAGNTRPGVVGQVFTQPSGGSTFTNTFAVTPPNMTVGAATAGLVPTDALGRFGFYAEDFYETLWFDFEGVRWAVSPSPSQAVAAVAGGIEQNLQSQLDSAITGWQSTIDELDANVSDLGEAFQQLSEEVAPPVGLVDRLVFPVTIAHRGGGAQVHPEESRQALIAAYESGFLLEVDVRPLADGTPVCCHDSTCDRTMTITGAVNSKTLSQWRAARIKPAIVGGQQGSPMTFEEVLDRFGGHQVIVPESYDTSTTATMINMIAARSLRRSIIGQSFNYSIAQQWAAAGIEAVYLVGSSAPAQSWTEIKAAGINFVGGSMTLSQASIDGAIAAGLKVLLYTVKTKSEHDAQLAKGAVGVFSDDPWGSADQVMIQARDPYELPHRPHGAYAYGTRAGVGSPDVEGLPLQVQPQLIGPGIGFSAPTTGNDSGYNRAISCPWAGKITRPVTIGATLRFLPQTGLTANMGFSLASSPDGLWHDNAFAGQNGFTFAFRRNGTIQAWRYVAGAAAASMGTAALPTAPAPDGEAAEVRLTVVVTATDVIVTGEAATGRASFTVADSTALASANLFLRYSVGLGAISDVVVVPG